MGRSGASRPALWRVMEIHKIVRADRYPNCQTLAREIEVTAKTMRDISFMRDQLGLPLEYDAIRFGYHCTRAVTEFPLLHLSRNDLVASFKELSIQPPSYFGLDVRPRLHLQSVGMYFMAVGQHMVCLRPNLREDEDAVWAIFAAGGVDRIYHLPSVPLTIPGGVLQIAKDLAADTEC